MIELSADRARVPVSAVLEGASARTSPSATVVELFTSSCDRADPRRPLSRERRSVRDHLLRHMVSPCRLKTWTSSRRSTSRSSGTGRGIQYSTAPQFGGRGGRGGRGNFPTYRGPDDADRLGRHGSRLSGERGVLQWLKALQERNLIVPVVGNFAGPKALRVRRPLRPRARRDDHDRFTCRTSSSTSSRMGSSNEFAKNVSTLPWTGTSTFIRSVSSDSATSAEMSGPDGRASALDPIQDFVRDVAAGHVRSYFALNERSR